MINNKFIIIIGSYNNAKWVESNIDSILRQDYSNYEVRYFDDASEDKTYSLILEKVQSNKKFHITHANNRKYKTWFFSTLDRTIIKDTDILIFLDGDDMFYCENVLSYLNEIYNQSGCWMTYGGMLVWNGDNNIIEPFPQNTEIPLEIHKNKTYRKDTWRTSHLKTMRGFIWNKINKSDLFYNGKAIVGPDDLAIMFAALELSHSDKIYRITEPLYLYNNTKENQHSRAYTDHKKSGTDYETLVRNRPPYKEISIITPTLIGGLGNQMFEIAAAAALAIDNDAILMLDNSQHICPNQGRNVNCYVDNIFSKLIFNKNIKIEHTYQQNGMEFNPIPYKPNLKICGHFQSLNYFDHHRQYILDLFAPTAKIDEELTEKYKWLEDCTAIQVRRGDALEHRCIGYHPVPTAEYFHETVKLTNSTRVVVFSDDIKWCKENLKFDVPCDFTICQGMNTDYMELYMMTKCKNIIISASTFGWWGAYLNPRLDKTVYVPKIFFGPKYIEMGFNINEFIPKDWIKYE